jgi:hypothetical protein
MAKLALYVVVTRGFFKKVVQEFFTAQKGQKPVKYGLFHAFGEQVK